MDLGRMKGKIRASTGARAKGFLHDAKIARAVVDSSRKASSLKVEMTKSLAKLTLSILCLLLAAEASFACTCIIRSVAQRKKDARAVFMGEVIANTQEMVNGIMYYRARIAVERSWKNAEVEEITVYSGGGCLAWLEPGQKYLVYAYSDKESGLLETDSCAGTGNIKSAEKDLRKLGKGKAVVRSKGA